MSCPERGTRRADGAGPYDEDVMGKVAELQRRGLLKMGFDRAGSTTQHPEDRDLDWTDPAQIRGSQWMYGFRTAAKKVMSIECQGFDGILVVVCIKGGPVTRVEHESMESIISDAKSDAEKSDVMCRIDRQDMSYAEFLRAHDEGWLWRALCCWCPRCLRVAVRSCCRRRCCAEAPAPEYAPLGRHATDSSSEPQPQPADSPSGAGEDDLEAPWSETTLPMEAPPRGGELELQPQPDAFTMRDLASPTTYAGKWARAQEGNRISPCGALLRGGARGLLWHVLQPVLYFLVFAVFSHELDSLQFALGALVGVREAVYLLLTVVCVFVNPAFLIVSVGASVEDNGGSNGASAYVASSRKYWEWRKDGDEMRQPEYDETAEPVAVGARPWETGRSFLLLYVLSPEKYVAFALLAHRETLQKVVVFGGILLDLCGVGALGAGIGNGVLPLPLAIGYSVSAVGGMAFSAV
jgi:hypothetical protein